MQFYIESPLMLRDEVSRHNYYLQLKYNAVNRDLPKECSEQSLLLLGGLSLQADLGDSAPEDAGTTLPTTPSIKTATSSTATVPCSSTANLNSTTGGGVLSSGVSVSSSNSTSSSSNSSSSASSNTSSATSSSTSSNSSTTSACSPNPSAGGAPSVSSTSTAASSACTTTSGPPVQPNTNIAANDGASSSTITTTTTSSPSVEYFRPDEYLNPALRSAWGIAAVTTCHRDNRGLSRADAETHFIREACNLNEAVNAHVFRMKQSKNETGLGTVALSIYAKGIRIAQDGSSTATTFQWPHIGKLSFDRKKFEIRSGDSKITLYSTNDDKNKMILALCRETHQFSMKIAPRLTEAIKREEEESSCIHGYPYLCSRALNLPYKSKSDQRISVISSTSSNTTSGIVSDRVHSEDELEIMINTPPTATLAAPSTESLALAHLLDCPSVSRQTSSVGQVSLKELEGTFAALSVGRTGSVVNAAGSLVPCSSGGSNTNNCANSDSGSVEGKPDRPGKECESSPSSQHNIGSQCSSTCSTVVVATDCLSLPQSSTATSTTTISNGGGSNSTMVQTTISRVN